MGTNLNFTNSFSTVPAEIITGHDVITQAKMVVDEATGLHYQLPGLGYTPIPVYFTLLTSMFMHGGLMHIAGNMLYLWIFGDNIENELGHTRYFIFYILCGVLASLSHVGATVFAHQNSLIPSLGASGAISGVMGAYMLLYPQKKVKALLFYFIVSVPAYVTLGLWIGFQLISGIGILGGNSSEGVAYAAHVGGFMAGLLLVKLFDRNKVIQYS